MKTMKFISAGTLCAATVLAGCNGAVTPITAQDVASVAGAIGGGYVGREIGDEIGSGRGNEIAKVVGAGLGALVGARVGAYLTQVDVGQLQSAARTAFTSGSPQQWQNPQTGNAGSIAVSAPFQQNTQNCRQYTQTVQITGFQPQTKSGTACEQGVGNWVAVS